MQNELNSKLFSPVSTQAASQTNGGHCYRRRQAYRGRPVYVGYSYPNYYSYPSYGYGSTRSVVVSF